MYPPRRGRLERSATRQPTDWTARRHVHPLPATATELADQLRLIVPHHPQCRWNTNPIRRPGESLAHTEAGRCTCTGPRSASMRKATSWPGTT